MSEATDRWLATKGYIEPKPEWGPPKNVGGEVPRVSQSDISPAIYLVDPLMDYEDCYRSLGDLFETGELKDGDEIIVLSDKPIDGEGKRSCKMYEWEEGGLR